MIKRPLLFGVLAFVIGELTGLNPYMTLGLGMAGVLLLPWCIHLRSREEQTMPVSVLLCLVFFLLGIVNGCRCNRPNPAAVYMEAGNQTSTRWVVEGTIKRMEYRKGQCILLIRTSRVEQEGKEWKQPCTLQLYVRMDSEEEQEGEEGYAHDGSLRVGNRIVCNVKLMLPAVPTNPGEFNSEQYYRARGIDILGFTDTVTVLETCENPVLQKLTELREDARAVFYQSLSEENAGIMGAMLLGTTGDLDSDIRTLYQRNGIAHILAISALHISIIGSALYRLLRKLGCSYAGAGIPVMVILISYGWMTGFSGSTIRAVIMFCLMLTGDILGRTYDMLTGVGIACLYMLIENPYRLWDAGFLLSFGAVLSLGIVVPVIQNSMEPLRRGRFRRYLTDGLCSGMVLQLLTGPIAAYFYYDVPIYGVFLNLIVIPLMTLLVICGFTGLLIYPVFPWLGTGVLLPCQWILQLFRLLCEMAEGLPGSLLHVGGISLSDFIIYYGLLILLFLLWKGKQYLPMVLLGIFLCGYVLLPVKGPLRITMLDIGQGDSILIETPEHQHILIDGGSSSRASIGEYVITPAAKYYGSGCLDYVFVSHMDQDHVNGILELIGLMEAGGLPIGCLVLPEFADTDEEFRELIHRAEEAGIRVTTMNGGEALVLDSISVTCMYPVVSREGTTFAGAGGSKNNNSMVLSLSYGAFDMLFTGDLEAEGEKFLLQEGILSQSYDVLKVGHHGSAGSTTMDFLEVVEPEFALISCGEHNSYGHPHADTLERLGAAGSRIFCTVDTGAIEIRTDGSRMEFHFYNADQ